LVSPKQLILRTQRVNPDFYISSKLEMITLHFPSNSIRWTFPDPAPALLNMDSSSTTDMDMQDLQRCNSARKWHGNRRYWSLKVPAEIHRMIIDYILEQSEPTEALSVLSSLTISCRRLHSHYVTAFFKTGLEQQPGLLPWTAKTGRTDVIARLLTAGAHPNKPFQFELQTQVAECAI